MTAKPQPRLSAADQLDRLTPRFDDLVRQARLARTAADYNDAEEAAQALSRDIVFAFRRSSPVNPPLFVSADGTSAAW